MLRVIASPEPASEDPHVFEACSPEPLRHAGARRLVLKGLDSAASALARASEELRRLGELLQRLRETGGRE